LKGEVGIVDASFRRQQLSVRALMQGLSIAAVERPWREVRASRACEPAGQTLAALSFSFTKDTPSSRHCLSPSSPHRKRRQTA